MKGTSQARMWWIVAIVIVVALAGFWIWRSNFETYHLAQVRDGVLYRDGNRGMREFANAHRKVKFKTVVMLNDDNELQQEPFKSELAFCQTGGIEVKRIPIPLGGWPTREQIDTFLSIVEDPRNQPVLVHCAQGVRRTGMMVAAYQESVLKYDNAQAKDAILTFGHSRRSIGDIEKFIDIYDPATREVTAQMPMSKE